VKVVSVTGTAMYGKEWACGSANWYSAVGEDLGLSVFGVICLELQVLDCLNCEVGGRNVQRKFIII